MQSICIYIFTASGSGLSGWPEYGSLQGSFKPILHVCLVSFSVLSGSREKGGYIVIHDVSPSAATETDGEGGVTRAPVVAKVLR